MAEDIDFIMPVIAQIIMPPKHSKPLVKDEKKSNNKSFTIEKSFKPQQKSTIPEKMRPQIQKIKMLLKAEREKQKKIKQLIAQGKLDRKDLDPQKKQEQKKEQKPKQKLIVDQTGKLRDQKGNLVFMKNQTIDLKINQKKAHENQHKELGKKQKIKFHEKLAKNLQDRNLVVSSSKKRARKSLFGLQFVEEEDVLDDQSQNESIEDLNQAVKKEHKIKHIRRKIKTNLQFNRDVPSIQWWDAQILDLENINKIKIQNPQQIPPLQQYIDITKLCNPVKYEKVGEESKKEPKVHIPLFLTKDERKKLKRKRKKEKLQQKNDKIRLGIIEPDKPKLKISNMAVVMKNQFIMDPSKVEKLAKQQVQERLNRHNQTNQQRKLTRAQKKDKIMRKLKRDSAKECRRIIFKLKKLQNPSHSFKVNMNSRQLALNGFILKPNQYFRQHVLIVAEGGQKAIKFFKNLMINRIKWGQDQNQCKIIWEGEVGNSTMGKWRTHQVGDQLETSKILKQKNLDNFYQYIV